MPAPLTFELIRGAARSLLQTRLRTFLTLAGITIGIAALFSLLSIAEGIRKRIVDEWLSSGLMTSLAVMPQGAPNPLRQGRGGRVPRTAAAPKRGETARTLDDRTTAEISKMAGVRRVWPVISRPVTLAPGAKVSPPVTTSSATTTAGAVASTDRGADTSNPRPGPADAPKPGATDAPSPRPEPADTDGRESAGAGSAASGGTGPHGEAPASDRPPSRANDDTEQVEYTTLRGMDADFYWSEDYVRVVAGAPFKQGSRHEALLMDEHLKSLGFPDAASAVGRTLLVRWREPAAPGAPGAAQVPGLPFFVVEKSAEFRIVGVYELRGALSLRNAGVLVPTEEAREIKTLDAERLRALFEGNAGSGGYTGLDVYLTPGADLAGIESKIRDMGFETLSGAEIVARIRRSILVLQSVLGGLGVIAIAVATLGIANTLLTAVYERMREIGVMKAVGARRRDIRRQFFAEAGLIGFIGGVSGIVLGFGADKLLAIVIGQISRRQGGEDPGAIAYHTVGIALGCLAFSIVLSLLAGTFPAARAARLDPIATLRHE